MIVRVETNFKLDIKHKSGSWLVPEDDKLTPEVHFVVYESIVDQETYSLLGMLNIFRVIAKFAGARAVKPKDEKQWKIVDFDDLMDGNPHTGPERPEITK